MNRMDSTQILTIYEEMARLTRHMLLAARAADWDRLVTCEKACAAQFALLFAGESDQPRDAAFQRRKAELIRGMLDDDAQVRRLADPWLAQLSSLIGNTRQQSRLHRTYSGTP